jgi:hypothetical protein
VPLCQHIRTCERYLPPIVLAAMGRPEGRLTANQTAKSKINSCVASSCSSHGECWLSSVTGARPRACTQNFTTPVCCRRKLPECDPHAAGEAHRRDQDGPARAQ